MEQKVTHTLKGVLGIFLIVFGITGMILPVLPGWWFIPIGLQLLGLKLVINRKKPWDSQIKWIKSPKKGKHKQSE